MEDKEYFENQGSALIALGIVIILGAIVFLSMMQGILGEGLKGLKGLQCDTISVAHVVHWCLI